MNPLVVLGWVDVNETCDWDTEVTNPVFKSVGWRISEPGAEFFQIATTQDADGNFSSILSVPTGCVLSVHRQDHEYPDKS